MLSPPRVASLQPHQVAVLGVPFDAHSSFLRGPALAPARIRETWHAGSANLCTELGLNLTTDTRWTDVGDVAFDDQSNAFETIEAAIAGVLAQQARALVLGGDHSITYPIIRAYAQQYPKLTILHLDAHSDLYDELDGNRYSHACPFARIMEAGLVERLIQVGIRTLNPHQRVQAERFGVEIIEMREWDPSHQWTFTTPLYISLDLDVLDPAYAPGVSHHEPGGCSTRDLVTLLHGLKAPIVGADIVEFNPVRDLVGMTGMVAVKLMKELLGKMVLGEA